MCAIKSGSVTCVKRIFSLTIGVICDSLVLFPLSLYYPNHAVYLMLQYLFKLFSSFFTAIHIHLLSTCVVQSTAVSRQSVHVWPFSAAVGDYQVNEPLIRIQHEEIKPNITVTNCRCFASK